MGQGPGVGRGMGPGQGMRPGQPAGPGQGMGPMAQRRGQGLGPMGRGQTVGRQQMMARRAPRAAAGIAGAMRRLNLTQTQKDQLKLGRDQVQKDLTASRDKLQTARQKLRDAMTAPVPDEAAVKAAGLAMATIQADRLALQARTRAQLMKVLTPEQQQQLRQFQQRMNRR